MLPLEKRLPFPLFTLDFEASGLGPHTYPIESGLAWWLHPNEPIESWSTLICPPIQWRDEFDWHAVSQDVRGIAPEELEAGMSPIEALETANRLVKSPMAFVDGGIHDARWMQVLARAAGIRPAFRMPDWDGLGGLLAPHEYQRMILWLDRQKVCHRAEADARLLLDAIKVGLGFELKGIGL